MEINIKTLLIEIRDLLESNKAILTIDEFVAYSGIKKSQVYKLTSGRKIPHYKAPGSNKIYFKKREIQKWLLSCPVKTQNEIKNEAINKLNIHLKAKGI